MRNRNTNLVLRGTSILFISIAIVATIYSLIGYSRQRNNYPAGMTIGGIPVGGLSPAEASQRLLEVYTSPVEIQYSGALIHIDPALVGFNIQLDTMLAAADLIRTGGPFWSGFWDYLWNRDPAPVDIPLSATFEEDRLRLFLTTEIAPRYDKPGEAPQPIPGSSDYTPGSPGETLDITSAVRLIDNALHSPTNRVVILSFQQESVQRPGIDSLETQLKQIIKVSGFDGVISLYMIDLQTGQEIHFAYNNQEEISVQPDVAFTASSTMKIPILVSYFIQHGSAPIDDNTNSKILYMIQQSDNPSSDDVMRLLDPGIGPLIVTQFMQKLGLSNTFIGSFFCDPTNPCAPLQKFNTPANQRPDAIITDPDPVNQTTSSDMGSLLADLYECAQNGGGALVAAFPDKMNQGVCKTVINYLQQDKVGSLLQAGVPDGTTVVMKHGWISRCVGCIPADISAAGIIYTPGGNYMLSIYTYKPENPFNPANLLFVKLTEATYNYFNLPLK